MNYIITCKISNRYNNAYGNIPIIAAFVQYIISVLQPPQNYISSLQKVFIDFLWQGRHWVKSDILYLRKSHDGLGLVYILSRLHAFRVRFIHDFSN